jgi:putative oxidoreductase
MVFSYVYFNISIVLQLITGQQMEWLKKFDKLYLIVGRSLLGLYFIIPGFLKIFGFSTTLTLMIEKGVPLSSVLLPLTIAIQLLGGIFLVLGHNLRLTSIMLFGLTILINIYIHDFWTLAGDPSYAHEFQNFVKNLAIAAGLLVLATKDKDKDKEFE